MTALDVKAASHPSLFGTGREFDRQVDVLVELGYPRLAGVTPAVVRAMLEPLRAVAVAEAGKLSPPTHGRVPFLLVLPQQIVTPSVAVTLTSFNGRPGFVAQDTADIDRFVPIESIDIPDSGGYLVLDIDRGDEMRNTSPDEAVARFTKQERSPMTIEEGIAFITHYPGALERNHCFQLAGSRCGDRRVPGLWISGRAPKLGFCWAGNRHTWLGMASCARRAWAT